MLTHGGHRSRINPSHWRPNLCNTCSSPLEILSDLGVRKADDGLQRRSPAVCVSLSVQISLSSPNSPLFPPLLRPWHVRRPTSAHPRAHRSSSCGGQVDACERSRVSFVRRPFVRSSPVRRHKSQVKLKRRVRERGDARFFSFYGFYKHAAGHACGGRVCLPSASAFLRGNGSGQSSLFPLLARALLR